MRANGIVFRCPGLFKGEVIIVVDETHKFIVIAMMATNATLEPIISCFRDLCKHSFPQCIHFLITEI